jgi:hypothetical protein
LVETENLSKLMNRLRLRDHGAGGQNPPLFTLPEG